MAGKVSIDAFRTSGRPYRVSIDPDATIGARVGIDLTLGAAVTLPNGTVLPAGYVIPASSLLNAFVSSNPGQGSGTSADWSQLTNIPANVSGVANLATNGLVTRTAGGSIVTRSLAVAARLAIANADGDAGNPSFDLALLADAGGGSLVKVARDAWGRVSGTSAATTDDLVEGLSNLYFTTERAQDAVGAAIAAGVMDGVTLTYVDASNRIDATNTDKGSVAVAAHVAAANPHPQYILSPGAGTTAQFLRGDNTWSDTLVGPFKLQSSGGTVSSIQPLDASGRLRLIGTGVAGMSGLVDMDPSPADGTSGASVRMLRQTNTTGATGLQIFLGNNTATTQHLLAGQGQDSSLCLNNGNLAIFGTGSFGSGSRVAFIANCTTPPSADPVGGYILYAEGGALKGRGSGGTVITIGPV